MPRRVPWLTFYALAVLVVAVLGHNLVFLLTYGADYGLALARTGHDSRWGDAVRVVLSAGVLLAAAATLRLAYLYRLVHRVRGLRPGNNGGPSGRSYAQTVLSVWVRLFLISTLLFVLQENIERWSSRAGLPWLTVLGSFAYGGPVIVFMIVSLVVATVVALFRMGIAALEARLAADRGPLPPAAEQSGRHRLTWPDRPSASILGRNLAGRAPPALLLA
jgi:hypothetical protein